MRTTINIDDTILRELKKRGEEEGKSLGRMVSDLLAHALKTHEKPGDRREQPVWIRRGMNARIDLDDKEALYAALDRAGSVGEESFGK